MTSLAQQESFLQPQSSAPVPLGASRKKIDDVAGSIALRGGYTPGSDLKSWVKDHLHGSVETSSAESDTRYGYLTVPGKRDKTGTESKLDITLSPFTGEFDDRFTIAHELGHYFLHCIAQGRDGLTVHREGNDRAETEANWFAEGFLMPKENFVEAWNELGGSIPALIHRFKVAADVISLRHKTLIDFDPLNHGFRYPGKWA